MAGEKNDDADFLSRWNQVDTLPDRWKDDSRVDCSLQFIWFFSQRSFISGLGIFLYRRSIRKGPFLMMICRPACRIFARGLHMETFELLYARRMIARGAACFSTRRIVARGGMVLL